MVNERTQFLKQELEKKLEECQRMANEFVELEKKRMEEKILQQQEEVKFLRKRLEETEFQLHCSTSLKNESKEMEPNRFVRKLLHIYKSEEDLGMVKSMDLDMDDQEVRIVGGGVTCRSDNNFISSDQPSYYSNTLNGVEGTHVCAPKFGERVCLSTLYEEEEGEGEEDHEVEKRVYTVDNPSKSPKREDYCPKQGSEDGKDTTSRILRIQNIFTLCGNQRELSQHIGTPMPTKKRSGTFDFRLSPVKSVVKSSEKDSIFKISNKENLEPQQYVVGN